MTKRFAEHNPQECFCGECDVCDPMPPLIDLDKPMTTEQAHQFYMHLRSVYDELEPSDVAGVAALIDNCEYAMESLNRQSPLYKHFSHFIDTLQSQQALTNLQNH